MANDAMAPYNFSWLVENKVCGLAFPGKDENLRYLLDNKVTYLITLTEELKPKVNKFPDMKHLDCNVGEFQTPTLTQIKDCMEFMELAHQNKKAVGVHCYHGRGRTGTVLACYLVKTDGMAAADAIALVREKRRWSIETIEQEETVYLFENHIKEQQLKA